MADIAILETRERVLAGILFTGAAYFLFSTQDASIKLLVTGMTVWQIMFFRSITILGRLRARSAGAQLFARIRRARRSSRPMLVRSAFTLAAWLCYYNAARSLQLAELTTDLLRGARSSSPCCRCSCSARRCRCCAGWRC